MKKNINYIKVLIVTFLLCSNVVFADSLISVKTELDNIIGEHKGEVIYVDFWASWCVPCRKSFPWMNQIQSEYQMQGFKVVSINLDAEKSLAKKFLDENPAKFSVLYDPKGELARHFKIQGMPSSFIINKQGDIKFTHSGFFKNKIKQYEIEINQLIAM